MGAEQTLGSQAYRVSADKLGHRIWVRTSHPESAEPALTVSGNIGLLTIPSSNNPMSQSKTPYGVELRKGTARSCREQQSNKISDSPRETVEPACRTREVGRGVERREWREMVYNSRMRLFYEPCEWCFPDGEPDDSKLDTVVRSCRKPTSYHRPREGDESACEHETSTEPDTHRPEPVEAITDLQAGERVIWEDREQPLRVTETTSKPDGTVVLRGPSGGHYHIEGRPDHRQPYYILGDGYRSVIKRVRAVEQEEAV